MNILETVKPTKIKEEFKIYAFKEDIDLFKGTLHFLQKNAKKWEVYSEEGLFEHIISSLRKDEELVEYSKKFLSKGKGSRPRKSDLVSAKSLGTGTN